MWISVFAHSSLVTVFQYPALVLYPSYSNFAKAQNYVQKSTPFLFHALFSCFYSVILLFFAVPFQHLMPLYIFINSTKIGTFVWSWIWCAGIAYIYRVTRSARALAEKKVCSKLLSRHQIHSMYFYFCWNAIKKMESMCIERMKMSKCRQKMSKKSMMRRKFENENAARTRNGCFHLLHFSERAQAGI